jgi:hypothetical protein
MKNLLYLFAMVLVSVSACSKNSMSENSRPLTASPFDVEEKILSDVQKASVQNGDAFEQSIIFTRAEFDSICELEDATLNLWSDELLLSVMPVESPCTLSYKERYRLLKDAAGGSRFIGEGNTVETFMLRSSGPARFDATPDVVAQVIAASGTTVGVHSSLNFWRPTFPSDAGTVTAFDITRAMSGVSQSSWLDTSIEYDPESVEFDFQVSGGNWLISADIIVTDNAGQSTIVSYGFNSPNGPLIWNPTLNSPADDDLIQGPLPNGIVSISANGLIPPIPAES